MEKLVIFDIDRTIYDGSIFLDFSLHLIQKNLISPKFLSSIGFEYVTYQTGFESYDELVRDCLNYFFDEIKKIPLVTLKKEIKDCLFINHHKFYDYVFETTKKYPSYEYLIITLEPEIIAGEVANFLKIKNYLSNRFCNNDEFLNKPELIFNKRELLNKSVFKNQIPFATFGDSESDLELLKISKNKFILNPTSNLQRELKKDNLNFKTFTPLNIDQEITLTFN